MAASGQEKITGDIGKFQKLLKMTRRQYSARTDAKTDLTPTQPRTVQGGLAGRGRVVGWPRLLSELLGAERLWEAQSSSSQLGASGGVGLGRLLDLTTDKVGPFCGGGRACVSPPCEGPTSPSFG